MSELNKIFKHLARDLFIYFFPGFIFILNIGVLDYVFNSRHYLKFIQTIPQWIFCTAVNSYLIGHVVFAVMYILFEMTGFENWIKRKLFPIISTPNIAFQIDVSKEITVFKKGSALHEQFIERHTQLYLMRWNLAGSLIFTGLLNLCFEFYFSFTYKMTFLFIILVLSGVILYILSLKTEKDCSDRVDEIEKIV